MHVKQIFSLLIGVYIFNFLFSCRTCTGLNTIDSKALDVGEEIWRETLQLQSGSRLYHLRGLKPYTWYEVKISYPASIPASFSLELMRGKTEMDLRMNRRLLNTEKIIFKTENLDHTNQDDGMYVLVSVEPEGFVAMPNVKEREFIIYNIVCDELLLGIPHKAWWVGMLVILCLGSALVIPSFLPPYLLPKDRSSEPVIRGSSKES